MANGELHHDVVEQFFPNPEGQLNFTTPAIIRSSTGQRFRAAILGGQHKEVKPDADYHVVRLIADAAEEA